MIDPELRSWLFVTRKLPRVRGAIRLARFAQRTYLRKPRARAVVPVRDFKMCLDPTDWVEGGLLFAPQLWDAAEVAFLGLSSMMKNRGYNSRPRMARRFGRRSGDAARIVGIRPTNTPRSATRSGCKTPS